MLRPNSNLYIPVKFVEDGVNFSAPTWEELAELVRKHREQRGVEQGDPLSDIFAKICGDYPSHCRGGAQPKAGTANRSGLNRLVLGWITRLVPRRDRLATVSEGEARRRAAICKGCPKQQNWSGSCTSCASSVDKAARGIIGENFDTPETRELRGCSALGEDCRVSAWIEQPPSKDDSLPGFCWRR